jgi:hypothetical protein
MGAVRRMRARLSLPIKCGGLCSRNLLPLDNCSFTYSLKVVSEIRWVLSDERKLVSVCRSNVAIYAV